MPMQELLEYKGLTEGRWGKRVIAVLVLCGVCALFALYLTGSTTRGLPGAPGCGEGSGCEQVLSSRFSKVGGGEGLPVSMLGLFAYVMLAAASWPMGGLSPMQAKLRPFARQAMAVAILAAAGWFICLQAVVIGGWCVGCIVLHGLGASAAVLVLLGERRQWKSAGLLAGLVMAGSLALLQWYGPSTQAGERTIAGQPGWNSAWTHGYDLIERDGRLIGELTRVPMWGEVNSERQVVLLYDLACPHCRSLHSLLDRMENLGVVAVSVPLHGKCNEFVSPRPPARFADSCERSALSVAVFVADPAMYEAFDAWCFAQDEVPMLEAMRNHAESLVGVERLQDALNDERTGAMLRAGVALFGQMKQQGVADMLPVVWETRHNNVLVGAVEDAEQVELLLLGQIATENTAAIQNP
jgi:uncharacterized membrane protein